MALTLRAAAAGDADAIAEIYRPLVERSIVSFEEAAPAAQEMARRIMATSQAYPWLVAQDGENIIGYAYAHRHRERAAYRYSAEVSVYVGEAARGRGTGTALYAALFDELGARGYHRAFAGIALPNDASVALHKRCGFEPVGVFKEIGFKFGSWIDVSWWQRALLRELV